VHIPITETFLKINDGAVITAAAVTVLAVYGKLHGFGLHVLCCQDPLLSSTF